MKSFWLISFCVQGIFWTQKEKLLFTEASERACSEAVYTDETVTVLFIASKTWFAPVKANSILRRLAGVNESSYDTLTYDNATSGISYWLTVRLKEGVFIEGQSDEYKLLLARVGLKEHETVLWLIDSLSKPCSLVKNILSQLSLKDLPLDS